MTGVEAAYNIYVARNQRASRRRGAHREAKALQVLWGEGDP